MDVADHFGKVAVAVADNRLITVLKQMAVAAVAQIVADRVAGEKTPHKSRQALRPAAE